MREKFGARTIFIPFFAVIGFFAVQIAVMIVYALVLFFTKSIEQIDSGAINNLLLDTETLLTEHFNMIASIYSIVISLIAILVIYVLLNKNPKAIRREKVSVGEWIASGIIIIGAMGMVTLQISALSALGEIFPLVEEAFQSYVELSETFVASDNIWMVIISMCILIPIAEDLVFRGIIQGELRRVMPAFWAVLIQAVIFALVHGNPIQISYVIIPAILLGVVYEWTKSIFVPIILHMLFNFFGAAFPMIIENNQAALSFFVLVQISLIPVAIIGLIYLHSKRKTDMVSPSSQVLVQNATGYSNNSYPNAINPDSDYLDIGNYSDAKSSDERIFSAGGLDDSGFAAARETDFAAAQEADFAANHLDDSLTQEKPKEWKHRDVL